MAEPTAATTHWEMVLDDHESGDTARLAIRGGWLYRYRHFVYGGEDGEDFKGLACAMVFVPDK